jgi:deoxyribodipyrimidine photo-lyase
MQDLLFPLPSPAATRADALAQLDAFAARAHRYARERNFVIAGHGNVSQLSPAIQHRLISQNEVIDRILQAHPFPAVEKFVQEVLWRSYWKGWLEARPGVWTDYLHQITACTQEDHEKATAISNGKSGCAVMDDFSRELLDTGYLHNHARMWWASFWIHQQGLPWALGAQHFMKHLLDADAASNTLSWRWVAGIQTVGKSYLVRRENIERYHHDPAVAGFEMLENVTPRLLTDTASRESIALPTLSEECPPSLQRTALLLHEDDLSVETTALASLMPQALGFFNSSENSSPTRTEWRDQAFADARTRAEKLYHHTCTIIHSPREIIDWIKRETITRLVMMQPFVGPMRDALSPLPALLDSNGIELVTVRRREDSELFPLAKSGFFPFWEKASRRFQ